MSDLIRRADAIEAIMKHHDGGLNQINYGLRLAKNEIQALPSAETTGALDDAIAKYVADGLMELPSADRPTGEWKGYNADNPNWLRKDGTPIFLVCDKCHGMVLNNSSANWNYCPNCGARMEGGDDE